MNTQPVGILNNQATTDPGTACDRAQQPGSQHTPVSAEIASGRTGRSDPTKGNRPLSFKRLKVFLHASVLEVSFVDDASQNAFDSETAIELNDLLLDLVKSSGCFESVTIGALLFTSRLGVPGGRAGVFLSGGNLKEIAADLAAARRTMLVMQENCSLLRRLPCLSICLLSGRCLGGGAEFALAADERWLGSSGATLELKQREWGLSSGWFGMSRLVELRPRGGRRAAAVDFARGRIWSAAELIADGLCECDFRQVTFDECVQRAIEVSEDLLRCPASLRHELLADDKFVLRQSAIDDLMRFERFWGSAEHQKALEKYRKSKAKLCP